MVKLIVEIIISIGLARVVPPRQRDILTPWALALLLGLATLTPYMPPMIMVVTVFVNFFFCCFLTNGYRVEWLRHNSVLAFFLLFWAYQCFSMVFGTQIMYSTVYYLQIPFESIFIGYFVGIWAMQNPERWERLLRIVTYVLFAVVVIYIMKGALSHGMGSEEVFRGDVGLDEDSIANPNWVGLVMIGILPYSVLLLMSKEAFKKKPWQMACAFFVSAMITLLLVRTGSRNACLGLVPILWYIVLSGVKNSFLKRGLILFALLVVLAGLIVETTSSVSDLRIFNANKSGDITSGRLDHYRNIMLYQRTPAQKWFGCGAWLDLTRDGRYVMANGHSVYVQMLRQSGYVGVGLFVLFVLAFIVKARKSGPNGKLALALFGVWLVTGIGESGPFLSGGGSSKILLGMALAFCANRRIVFPGMDGLAMRAYHRMR